jgi:S1-C subfamily serine protease
VPTDIVRKVVEDLIRHGIVQKAFFGGDVLEYNFANAQKYELNTDVQSFHGVVLAKLDENGPAAKAGLKLRDIITKINGVEVNSESAFDEILSYAYPGDEIEVTYERNQKTNTVRFQLVNKNGTTTVIKRKIYSDSNLGAQLEATDYGVKVNKIREGGLFKRLGIPENYTIVILNRNRVNDPQKVIDFFNDYKGTVYMNGFTSAKQEMPLRFNLR